MDTNFKTIQGLSLFIRNEVSKKNHVDKNIIVHFTFIFSKSCQDTEIFSTFINEMQYMYHSDWLVKMVDLTLRGLSLFFKKEGKSKEIPCVLRPLSVFAIIVPYACM